MCYTFLLLRTSARVLTFRLLSTFDWSRSMNLQTDKPGVVPKSQGLWHRHFKFKENELEWSPIWYCMPQGLSQSEMNNCVWNLRCKKWSDLHWSMMKCICSNEFAHSCFLPRYWCYQSLPNLFRCSLKAEWNYGHQLLKCLRTRIPTLWSTYPRIWRRELLLLFLFFFPFSFFLFCCFVLVLFLLCFPSHLSAQPIHRNLVPRHP